MCGIAGFIGKSKNTELSFDLLTFLFEKLDSRGIDATGYWLAESGKNGSVYTHKQPGKSSEFVKTDLWNDNKIIDYNLALVHARGASRGSGSPLINKNNHPFLSQKKNIALVHNGKIDGDEYDALTQKYEVFSECDSEILLRIFEQAKYAYSGNFLNEYVGDILEKERIAGIKDIFSYINQGHMAVAIGEYKENNARNLWLFRNEHRPLWLADTRKSLGQVFFFSEPLIWSYAIKKIGKKELFQSKIIEILNHEVWQFSIDANAEEINHPIKYCVTSSGYKKWSYNGSVMNVPDDDIELNVISPINATKDKKQYIQENYDIEKTLDSMERKIEKIQETCRNIYTTSQVMMRSNSLSLSDMEQILSLLDEQQKSFSDIENIFH